MLSLGSNWSLERAAPTDNTAHLLLIIHMPPIAPDCMCAQSVNARVFASSTCHPVF